MRRSQILGVSADFWVKDGRIPTGSKMGGIVPSHLLSATSWVVNRDAGYTCALNPSTTLLER